MIRGRAARSDSRQRGEVGADFDRREERRHRGPEPPVLRGGDRGGSRRGESGRGAGGSGQLSDFL